MSSLVCGKVGGPGDLVDKTADGLLVEPRIIFLGRQIKFLFLNGPFANKVDSQNHGAWTHTLQCPSTLRGGPKGNNNNPASYPAPLGPSSFPATL